MRSLKIYLDTSVIGGCFDDEFAEESNILILSIIAGKYIAVISDITILELSKGPEKIQNIIKEIPDEYLQEIHLNNEIISLSEEYIFQRVIPEWC